MPTPHTVTLRLYKNLLGKWQTPAMPTGNAHNAPYFLTLNKQQKAILGSKTPFQQHLQCTDYTCGCRFNSLIWVNTQHKIVYYEIPKNASRSVFEFLQLNHPYIREISGILYKACKQNHNSLLIEVPKTYATILQSALKGVMPKAHQQYKANPTLAIHNAGNAHFNLYLGSATAAAEQFKGYFQFAVLRDPTERFMSNYRMFTQHPLRQAVITEQGHPPESFNTPEKFFDLMQHHHNHHWEPQVKYLPHNNSQVQFYGMQQLSTLFAHLAQKMELQANTATIPAVNATQKNNNIEVPQICKSDNFKAYYQADFDLLNNLA